jgi:hypothetical protein
MVLVDLVCLVASSSSDSNEFWVGVEVVQCEIKRYEFFSIKTEAATCKCGEGWPTLRAMNINSFLLFSIKGYSHARCCGSHISYLEMWLKDAIAPNFYSSVWAKKNPDILQPSLYKSNFSPGFMSMNVLCNKSRS